MRRSASYMGFKRMLRPLKRSKQQGNISLQQYFGKYAKKQIRREIFKKEGRDQLESRQSNVSRLSDFVAETRSHQAKQIYKNRQKFRRIIKRSGRHVDKFGDYKNLPYQSMYRELHGRHQDGKQRSWSQLYYKKDFQQKKGKRLIPLTEKDKEQNELNKVLHKQRKHIKNKFINLNNSHQIEGDKKYIADEFFKGEKSSNKKQDKTDKVKFEKKVKKKVEKEKPKQEKQVEGEQKDDKEQDQQIDPEFDSNYDCYMNEIEELKDMIKDKYPDLYENNDEYFNQLIERIILNDPAQVYKPYKNSPMNSLKYKTSKFTKSCYQNDYQSLNSSEMSIPMKNIQQSFYTQKIQSRKIPTNTSYNVSQPIKILSLFRITLKLQDQLTYQLQRKDKFLRAFIKISIRQDQQSFSIAQPTEAITQITDHLKHLSKKDIIQNMLLMKFLLMPKNKKPLSKEKEIEKIFKEKFFKKTKLYTDVGNYYQNSKNSEVYKNPTEKKVKISKKARPQSRAKLNPSFLRQYESTSAHTYTKDQYKQYDEARLKRKQKVQSFLDRIKVIRNKRRTTQR